MKNLIAIVLVAAALISGTALSSFAQKPQGPNAAAGADNSPLLGKAAVAPAASTGTTNFRFTVSANAVRYHTYRMAAGETVRIELSGDGDTDLDMYVYSSDGVLIDKRESFSDSEVSYITANRAGTITIKVVNRGGVYNEYDLSVF